MSERKTEIKEAEYRTVSLVGGTSLTIVLPRHFSKVIGVERGDYVKIVQDGKRLIVEKADWKNWEAVRDKLAVKTFYPPEIYKFLFDIAFKNNLAIKEVETIFLRAQARELGFECLHQKVGFAKSDGKPYCKGCWVRLEQIRAATVTADHMGRKKVLSPATYRPVKTFLDQIEAERARENEKEMVRWRKGLN